LEWTINSRDSVIVDDSANGALAKLNSTIHGNPDDFAIEVMTEPHLVSPSAIWGRMCIHIGDLTLGDFAERHCALYSSYRHFESLSREMTPLWDTSFNGLTLEQIHDTVRDAIYGDAWTSGNAKRYARYDFLTNWGEHFDWYASVIAQPPWNTVTIMYRPSSDAPERRRVTGDFLSAKCTFDGFRDAATRFVEWFDAETKRLSAEEAEP